MKIDNVLMKYGKGMAENSLLIYLVFTKSIQMLIYDGLLENGSSKAVLTSPACEFLYIFSYKSEQR